jgi:hypothetical protein
MSALAWGRRVVIVLMGCFSLSSLALASSNTGTLTRGADSLCPLTGIQYGFEFLEGFSSGSFGSYSPVGLTGGESVEAIWDVDHYGGGPCGSASNSSFLSISGFSVDPGQDWLSSIKCNGVQNDGSAASSYSYSGGTASWAWSQVFGIVNNSSVSCTIVHD